MACNASKRRGLPETREPPSKTRTAEFCRRCGIWVNQDLQMLPAPPPKPQSPFEQWLRAAHSGEWFEVIERHESTGWSSIRKPFTIDGLINHFFNPDFVSGIRQEKFIRYGVADIDHKEDYASQYWNKFAKSPELIELEERAERIGCRVSFLRSSHSGGLHVFVSFPEAIHAWLAHWLMLWLLEASGMAVKAGQAEVFPSRIHYCSDGQRARSNGFRLPGQEGSALIVAETFYEGVDRIYGQLLDDLENTELCGEWKQALKNAERVKLLHKRSEKATNKNAVTPDTDLEWTGKGCSNELMARITTLVRLANRSIKCPIELGKIIANTAMSLTGFNKFASEETKKDLMLERGGWGERWAKSSLRKHFCGMLAAQAKDSDRNERLFNESRETLKKLAEENPGAGSWSKRRVARESGLARGTVEKHWDYWVSLVEHTSPNNGGGQLEPAAAAQIRERNAAGSGLLLAARWNLHQIVDRFDSILELFTEGELNGIDFGVPGNGFLQDHDRSRRKQSLPMDFCT